MTSTYQTDLTHETYQGWSNHATWNVALWLSNDEGLYHMARGWARHGYKSLSHQLVEAWGQYTPDGVDWQDNDLNLVELDEMLEEM